MTNKIDRNARVAIPGMFIPGFRSSVAIDTGCEKNLLFKTWGGLRRHDLCRAHTSVCSKES